MSECNYTNGLTFDSKGMIDIYQRLIFTLSTKKPASPYTVIRKLTETQKNGSTRAIRERIVGFSMEYKYQQQLGGR